MARLTSLAVSGLAAASLAATAVVTLVTPGAALANDNHTLNPLGICSQGPSALSGYFKFVDNGPGAAGGGNNDDYFVVADTCPDGHGIKAWAWVDGVAKGDKYVGAGNGTKVVWDPIGNVKDGHSVGMEVCLVDGNAGTPRSCSAQTFTLNE
jgi:hypothetical protein